MKTRYLIIGSSHAGLSAAEEIRMNDREGSLTMVTREDILPYSPTILPYIISGKVSPDQIRLRDNAYFKKNRIRFVKGKAVTRVDPKKSAVTLSDGRRVGYEKLLIATGAEPTIPQVENLPNVPFLELRTMADALRHRDMLRKGKTAGVMGTGLVGMHAAENFVSRGMQVHVVRARPKKNPRVLPNYFDDECSGMIQDVFEAHGVKFYLENHAVRVDSGQNKIELSLHDGKKLRVDILLVCTGVAPRIEFLTDSEVDADQGILVDRKMKTSVDNVWAAGDVAQADDFFGGSRILNAILPDAVAQGKIAGANMSGGHLDSDYEGGISMNTFNFFGHRAFSIGLHSAENGKHYTVDREVLPSAHVYQKTIFQGDVLVGASGINIDLDPGIIMNLIKRKVALKDEKAEFVSNRVNMSRRLMWKLWR